MSTNLTPVDTCFVFQTYHAGEHMFPIARFLNIRLNTLLESSVKAEPKDSRLIIRTKELTSYEDLEKWIAPEMTLLGFIVHPSQYVTQRNKAYHDEKKSTPDLEKEKSTPHVMLEKILAQLHCAEYELKVAKSHEKENLREYAFVYWCKRQTESLLRFLLTTCDLENVDKEKYAKQIAELESRVWRKLRKHV